MVAAVVIQTDLGRDKLAKLALEGKTLKLTQFAVGDANDNPYTPTGQETKLVHEKYRSDISLIEKDEVSAATLKIINIVPSTSGGYTIREIGLFDEDNDLIAIGVCEIIKPDPKTVPYTSKITILLTIDNAESVEFKINIDGYVTHDYLINLFDKEIVKLNSPNLVNADSNFLGKLQKDGYDVATYNAGFNKSVSLTADYEVKPTDANTIFRPQDNFLITANGKTTAFPVGFTFFVAGTNVLQYRVRTVNSTGSSDTTVTLPVSGIYQYMWSGSGWFTSANSAALPNGLNITNPYNIGAGIIASGSNTDGSWVKFANGLIQQWGHISTSANNSTATQLFPVAFLSTPRILLQAQSGEVPPAGYYGAVNQILTTNTTLVVGLTLPSGAVSPSIIDMLYFAIGY